VYHSVALQADGTVWTWGDNSNGQLGNGKSQSFPKPIKAQYLNGFTSLFAGGGNTVALKADGTMWVLGNYDYGTYDYHMENGISGVSLTPIQISGFGSVSHVSKVEMKESAKLNIGASETLTATIVPANATNKEIKWESSNVGIATVDSKGKVTAIAKGAVAITATTVDGKKTATCVVLVGDHNQQSNQKISAGSAHSAYIASDGSVWMWGSNAYGQLGDGTTATGYAPSKLSHIFDITDIACGDNYTLALQSGGAVWTWGNNAFGQLGDETKSSKNVPTRVKNLSGIKAISAGAHHAIALKSDGTVWAWGRNNYGQLGDGTTIDKTLPTQVAGLSSVKAIAAGDNYSVAVKEDGTVYSWGYNNYGQLGDGSTETRKTPVQVQDLLGVVSVAAGREHTIALKSDGSIFAWGNNSSGRLGDGTQESKYKPVHINSISEIISISSNRHSSAALKSDGTLYVWGSNYSGQLADEGKSASKLFPTEINGLIDMAAIAVGGDHTVSIKADGAVFAWGANDSGQLGIGSEMYGYYFPPQKITFEEKSNELTLNNNGSLYYNFPSTKEGYDTQMPHIVKITNNGTQPTGPIKITQSFENSISSPQIAAFTIAPRSVENLLPGETACFTVVPTNGLLAGTYETSVEVSSEKEKNTLYLRFTVELADLPVKSVQLDKTSIKIAVGTSEKLQATVVPLAASNREVLWHSSNNSIVTVDGAGVITAVSSGSATITATTKEGNKKDYCYVSVVVPVESLTFNEKTVIIPAGTTEQLAAAISPENATNKTIKWSSNAPSVATVDNLGNVTARAVGVTSIYATSEDGEKTDSCQVIVPSYGVSLGQTRNHTFSAMTVGYSSLTPLSVTVRNTGNVPTGALSVLLEGENPSSFTVNPSTMQSIETNNATRTFTVGPKHGLPVGTYTATVSVSGENIEKKSFNVSFTVNPVKVSKVTMSPTTASLVVGGTRTLTATISPSNATNQTILWSSSDDSIATVNQAGEVLAVDAGKATIAATSEDGNMSATCVVTVSEPPRYGITLDKQGLQLFPDATVGYGAQSPLAVKVTNTGNQPTGALTIVKSGDNADNFTVSSATLASIALGGSSTFTVEPRTGLPVGTYTATIAVRGSQVESKSFDVSFTVKPVPVVPVTAILLNKQSTIIAIDASETLKATVVPDNATNKAVTWSSSSATIAAVDQNGTVTAKSAGTATITVRTQDGGFTATCTVTVPEAPRYGVALDKQGLQMFPDATVGYGKQSPLTVKATNTGNQPTGALTIVKSGDNADSFTVSSTTLTSIALGGSITFTVEPRTGLPVGTHTATIIVWGAQVDSKSFMVSFTVKPVPAVPATGVSINKNALELSAGTQETLIATVMPDNATNKKVLWKSENSDIASVDANGKVSAVSKGTTVIRATTEDGEFLATCNVVVTEAIVPVSYVSIDLDFKYPNVDSTFKLNARVSPENATHKQVTWSSNNPAVATVDENGVVTTLSPGSVNIIATSHNGRTSHYYFSAFQSKLSLDKKGIQSFGSVGVGYAAPTPLTVKVTNTDSKASGAITLALRGANPSSFTLSATKISNISGNRTASFTVKPKAGLPVGTYTANVAAISATGIESIFVVTFTVEAATYEVTLDPEGLIDFGLVAPGYPAQKSTKVVVSNVGNQATGALKIEIIGNNPKSFRVATTSTAAATATLGSIAVNKTGTFSVVPTTALAVGTHKAKVRIYSTTNGIEKFVDVEFTVVPATYDITLDPEGSIVFPSAAPGYPAQKSTKVMVKNEGNQATGSLKVELIGENAKSFKVATTSTAATTATLASVAVGKTGSFTVVPVTGLKADTYKAQVKVSHAANGILKLIDVEFTVVPATYGIELEPEGPIVFPSAAPGYAAQRAETIKVTNKGNQATGALSIKLSGENPTSFTTTVTSSSATSMASIAVNGSKTFTVKPKTALKVGTHKATVSVTGANGISKSFDVEFTVGTPQATSASATSAAGAITTASGATVAASPTFVVVKEEVTLEESSEAVSAEDASATEDVAAEESATSNAEEAQRAQLNLEEGLNLTNLFEPKLSVGESHSAIVEADGTVWTQGLNEYGQLGNGNLDNSDTPVQAIGLEGATQVEVGTHHTLALTSKGTVWAWGANESGQLGNATFENSKVPVQVGGLTNIIAIAAGANHSVALAKDGSLFVWGTNTEGQLGESVSDQDSSNTPVLLGIFEGAVLVAAGNEHTLVLMSDGTVLAWGANDNGQLGDATVVAKASPALVKNLSQVVSVAANDLYSAALLADGTIWAWGYDASNTLLEETPFLSYIPHKVL